MANFFSLIFSAVQSLPEPTKEARSDLYNQARLMLVSQLCNGDNPAAEWELTLQTAALNDAIARVELDFAQGLIDKNSTRHLNDLVSVSSPEGALPPALEPSDRRQFALNAALAGVVNISKTLLQLVLLPLMAHLLGPTSYGIYSLAFPTVMFFMMIADGGLGLSLSREDEKNSIVWATAFWTLLATCTIMAFGVVASGFVLARVSGQASLVGIMAFLALVLPLLAVSVPADARLMRRGNGFYHSASDFVGSIVGAIVALSLAYNGAGAWALAAQYVTTYSIRALILNIAAWSPPELIFDIASLRGHVSTSGGLLVSRLGDLAIKLAENSLFGHVFGTATLGSYTLANQVARFTCDAVTNPVIGAFYVQSLRESEKEIAALHAKMTRWVLLILFPVTTFMAVAAPDVFPIVLGREWVEAAPLFQGIVVAYALAAVSWLSGQILLRHGLTVRSAKVTISCGALRVASVGLGFWFTPVSVAWLVGGTYVIQAIAMTVALPEGLGASLSEVLRRVRVPAFAAIVGACTSSYLISRFHSSMISAAAASLVGACVYLILLFTFEGRALRDDMVGLTRVVRKKSS